MNPVIFKCGELRRNREIWDRAWLVFAGRMGKHTGNRSEHGLQPGTFDKKSDALPLGQSALSMAM
jgi:hypothetical protein